MGCKKYGVQEVRLWEEMLEVKGERRGVKSKGVRKEGCKK